jgi:hypothetical protein
MKYLLVVPMLLLGSACGAEPPEVTREKGFAALKAAQDDPDRIVEAAKLLAEASEAFLAAGNEKEAQETEAFLFWAKKKMTIQQIDAFVSKGDQAKKVVAKLEAVEKKEVKPEEAAIYLARVDGYAENAKDSFLVAVRYFEVASRFKGTPEAEKAMEKSLAALQNAKVSRPEAQVNMVREPAKPAGPFAEFAGTWTIAYSNNAIRVYTIDPRGNVLFIEGREYRAILRKISNGDVIIDFNNGQLETISQHGTDILIKHYNPKTRYPAYPPRFTGIGRK